MQSTAILRLIDRSELLQALVVLFSVLLDESQCRMDFRNFGWILSVLMRFYLEYRINRIRRIPRTRRKTAVLRFVLRSWLWTWLLLHFL